MAIIATCTGQCREQIPLDDVFDDGRPHDEAFHARMLFFAQLLNANDLDDTTLIDFYDIDGMSVMISPLLCAGGSLTFEALLYEDQPDGHDGQLLGRLALSIEPLHVDLIETHPAYVRRGVASALYAHAVAKLGPIAHSVARTLHGDLWAHAVGGELPMRVSPDFGISDFDLWSEYWEINCLDPQITEQVAEYFPEVGDCDDWQG